MDTGVAMDEEDYNTDGGEIEVPIENTESTEKSDDSGNNRALMYGGIACCVIVILAIVLGVGYGTGSFGNSGEAAPAPAPGAAEPTAAPAPTDPVSPEVDTTTTDRVDAFNTYLATVSFDPNALDDPTSAEWTTVRYMANSDPATLDPTDTTFENQLRINQRYSLLLLYFGSDQDSWANQENWLNEDECTWYGISCGPPVAAEGAGRRNLQAGDATVTVVNLEDNGILGRFPPDLALLTELVTLNLSGNGFDGPLPSSLSTMVSLTELSLANNNFMGPLSDADFEPLASLTTLDLSGNGFTGAIADSIYGLSSLQILVLDENLLTGAISTNVGNMASLTRFTAGDNALTGPVPSELTSLANLGAYINALRYDLLVDVICTNPL
jgi:hypothetical protein